MNAWRVLGEFALSFLSGPGLLIASVLLVTCGSNRLVEWMRRHPKAHAATIGAAGLVAMLSLYVANHRLRG